MVRASVFFDELLKRGIDFFAGVPDSLLKDFCAYVSDHAGVNSHVITANEGNAIGLAAGHVLGSGSPALVYLQNSGLGNAVNPLLSLNDPEVYGLPVLLMIGWRGEPGGKDEPQHIKQGRVTPGLLDLMGIPWQRLDRDTQDGDVGAVLDQALLQMCTNRGPAALLVRKNAFEPYQAKELASHRYLLAREQVIQHIVEQLDGEDRVVVTTGMASRELHEFRVSRGEGGQGDFLTVGSMGHASSIALGLARTQPDRRILCLDGDGSVLMHMGALAIIAQSAQQNLLHIVLNNGAHDSVGGQPTCGFSIDLAGIARACGYRQVAVAKTLDFLDNDFAGFLAKKGPSFLEIRINKGFRNDLGRPTTTPAENRDALMSGFGVHPPWSG